MLTINEEAGSPRRTVLFDNDKPELSVKFTEAGIYKSSKNTKPIMFVDDMVDAIIAGGPEMADVLHKIGWITSNETAQIMPPSREYLKYESDVLIDKVKKFVDLKNRSENNSKNIIFSAIFNVLYSDKTILASSQSDAIKTARNNLFSIARTIVFRSLNKKGKRKNEAGVKAEYGNTVLDAIYKDILPAHTNTSSISYAGASRRFVNKRKEAIKKKFKVEIPSIAAFLCIMHIQSVDDLQKLNWIHTSSDTYNMAFEIADTGDFLFNMSWQTKDLVQSAIEESRAQQKPLCNAVAEKMLPYISDCFGSVLSHILYHTIGLNASGAETLLKRRNVSDLLDKIHNSTTYAPHTPEGKALLCLIANAVVRTNL